jgi:predicted phage-related endonuclease
MRTSDLEDVLSIEKYRTQAEKGYIYICDADVVEEVGLTEEYKNILDDKAMSHVLNLVDDNAVDMFCALDSDMKESIAIHIAENLANNKPVDRNRLFNIKLKTNIDIEKMAEDLKSARDKLNN